MSDHDHVGDSYSPNLCVWTENNGEMCQFPLNEDGLLQVIVWSRDDLRRKVEGLLKERQAEWRQPLLLEGTGHTRGEVLGAMMILTDVLNLIDMEDVNE